MPIASANRRWLLFTTFVVCYLSVAASWLLPGRPLWPACAGAVLLGVVIATGVASFRSGVFGAVVYRARPEGDALALTFDDGPDPEHTLRIAAQLEEAGHRGTFFVVGERARAHPGVVRALVERGHHVGIHSLRHDLGHSFPSMRWLWRDFLESSRAVADASGRWPRLYRPPVGLLNPRILRVARQGDWVVVGWSLRSRDGVRTDAGAVERRVVSGLGPGEVVLLHDRIARGEPAVLKALPGILAALERRGLRSVGLGELLGTEPYGEAPAVPPELVDG